MNRPRSWLRVAALASCMLPAAALAQAPGAAAESWQFALTAYGYLPQISGTAYFPVTGTGSSFTLDQGEILDHLKMTFMGAFDVHHGQWGLFTDVLYLDLGQRKTGFRDLTIGNIGIPAGTSSDVSLDMKSWVVNAAGEYRVLTQGESRLDVIAGLRYTQLRERLEWSFTGSLGSLPPTVRAGSAEVTDHYLDAIVGVKGQVRFGSGGRWAVPVYFDVGGGASDFTWQGAAGIAYGFSWGELGALYRYIDFQFGPGDPLKNLNIGGPLVGATLRW